MAAAAAVALWRCGAVGAPSGDRLRGRLRRPCDCAAAERWASLALLARESAALWPLPLWRALRALSSCGRGASLGAGGGAEATGAATATACAAVAAPSLFFRLLAAASALMRSSINLRFSNSSRVRVCRVA